MSEQMEELVEEIASLALKYRQHPGLDLKDFAKKAITRTLKAVADGMPLPDEVAREWLRYTYPPGRLELIPFQKWLEKIIKQAKQSGKQTLFIALSGEKDE